MAVYRRYVDRAGALVGVELFVEVDEGSGEVGADLLRSIPVGRIDAEAARESAPLRDSMTMPGPDLRRAARHLVGTPRRGTWVAGMFEAQMVGSSVSQPKMPALKPLTAVELEPVDARLNVPLSRPFPDSFYADVARLYRQLSLRTRAVATEIADANKVHTTQVHRWIKVAREKGFLGKGQRGKVG